MAAPASTPRQTPTGVRMPDGFTTKIGFSAAPALGVWERAVKPPAIDGGEPIDISTMHNAKVHTMHPRKLVKYDAVTVQAAYDPDTIGAAALAGATFQSLVNSNQAITLTFAEGSTLDFYGYLQKVEFGDLKEGEFPECTLAIVVTNYDSVNFVEATPVFTAGSGEV